VPPAAQFVTRKFLHKFTFLGIGKILPAGCDDLKKEKLHHPKKANQRSKFIEQGVAMFELRPPGYRWHESLAVSHPRQTHPSSLGKSVKSLWLRMLMLLMLLNCMALPAVQAAITSYPDLGAARFGHAATVLGNGTVLITGGMNANGYLNSVEIFTPGATPTWTPAAAMNTARRYHTATELPNGKILIAGGEKGAGSLTSAVSIYDPKLGTWAPAANMATPRARHAATLLGDGRVLVTGGGVYDQGLNSAEIYDWQTNTWSSAGSFSGPRFFHTATRLYNGKVLVAGGGVVPGSPVALASAALYDPVGGTWTTLANSMTTARYQHAAVALSNGKVLMVSGRNGGANTASAELFDPDTGNWTAAAPLSNSRSAFASLLLPDGRVVVSGGWTATTADNTVTQVEVYEPRTNTWSTLGNATGRQLHTMVRLGNGDIQIAGGAAGASGSTSYLNSVQRVGYAAAQAPSWTGPVNYLLPGWIGRRGATSVLIPNGLTMVAGGVLETMGMGDYFLLNESGAVVGTTSYIFNPWDGETLGYPTLTVLNDGRLLMSGAGSGQTGWNPICCSVVYPYANGQYWGDTQSQLMNAYRFLNAAVLLKNGKVLSVGGNLQVYRQTFGSTPLAEIFDPASNTWTASGPNLSLDSPKVALLADGSVLVTGTSIDSSNISRPFTSIYNPYADTWTTVPNMNTPRNSHVLVKLPNGKVLAAGGSLFYGGGNTLTAELFDPDTLTWSSAGTMANAQAAGAVFPLANGDVLLANGNASFPYKATTIYRFATNDWIAGPPMPTSRFSESSWIMLPNGKAMLTDGSHPGSKGNSDIFSLNYSY
jgi:N-acetylneuraminic acid mutarotase